MISRYTHNGMTWIDCEAPQADELLLLADEFAIPHHLTTELLEPTMRSKTDLYDTFIYVVLHFPHSENLEDEEIDVVIGKNYIITIRYQKSSLVNSFLTRLETSPSFQNRVFSHPTALFVNIMKKYYAALLTQLDSIARDIALVERNIFSGKQEKAVRELSENNRALIDFHRAICLHSDVLDAFLLHEKKLFGESFMYNASLLQAEYGKVFALLQSHRETLSDLQKTNDSLLSAKQNNIMKNFTIISFVTFPLMLVTGIFGMNTADGLIFIKDISDFFTIIGAMFLTSLTMFLFFKLQKWL